MHRFSIKDVHLEGSTDIKMEAANQKFLTAVNMVSKIIEKNRRKLMPSSNTIKSQKLTF